MTGDLVEFLRARLDEDEATAREACGLTENWIADEPAIGVVLVDGEPLIEGHVGGLTAHIARHDPARVLREVAAKRAILAEHGHSPHWEPGEEILDCQYYEWPCPSLRASAAVYSDHPDYRPEWA